MLSAPMATARRYALWTRLVLTALYLLGIVAQFLLAGYGFFEGDWDAHEGLGWSIMHGLPLLILIATLVIWRRGPDLWLALAIGALGIAQPFLASAGEWAGVFHPFVALVLFMLAQLLLRYDRRALRTPALRARDEPTPAEVGAR
jgi:Family of unknown function (DUF6220)